MNCLSKGMNDKLLE